MSSLLPWFKPQLINHNVGPVFASDGKFCSGVRDGSFARGNRRKRMAMTPISILNLQIPIPANPYPSLGNDWQDEVIYFRLSDRFSDGREDFRQPLNRSDKRAARGPGGSWKYWAA